jgi:hypothetical protein
MLLGIPLAATLVVGIAEYPFPPGVQQFMHGAPWLPEVRKFRSDSTYGRLQIAPAGWGVTVPSSAR